MITFIYKAIDSSGKRGYNREIQVYRVKNNVPEYVGFNDEINTAGYRGDYAEACQIISIELGYKMNGSYRLKSNKIQVLEV